MGKPLPAPPPGFRNLSVPGKIHYVQALWDDIAEDADKVPVPAWHKHILDDRLAKSAAGGPRGKSWARARRDIEKALHSRRRG